MDILDEIVAYKRHELEQWKAEKPLSVIASLSEKLQKHSSCSIKTMLLESESGVIAEYKRRSPSKGWINEAARPDIVPLSYQENGASAVSILTDEKYFGGRDEFIVSARQSGVKIPILYKNFVIDEYQLHQARLCGATAVLLIAACLTKQECKHLLHKAHELELEVLLEMHNDHDLEYAELEPDMYGINNRNLGTFHTDIENSFRFAELLPKGECLVSESGISSPSVIKELQSAGYKGFLIGENFMKTEAPGEALGEFIKCLKS